MADQNYQLKPGFQSSRGAEIITSLCALVQKMKDLEQPQVVEPERKDVGTNPDYLQSESSEESSRASEHSLIQEMKLKLLAAQIYSITCLLNRKFPKHTRNARTNTEDTMFVAAQNTNSRAFDDLDQIPVKLTRTENSRYQNTVTDSEYCVSSLSSAIGPIYQRKNHHSHKEPKQHYPVIQKPKTSSRLPSAEKKPPRQKHRHFHMNLSKVPFILGTSATPSHSLTANVQSIIWTLKTHNNFCMPSQTPVSHQCSTPKMQRKQDYTMVLKNLGKDFNKLSIHQRQLKELLSENKDRPEKKIIHEQFKNISDLLQNKAKQIVECHRAQSEGPLGAKTKEKIRPSSDPLSAPYWDLA